jgi:UDP-glucose 4-epimerase
MRILVTGGAGYVGSVSVERLVAAGHEVVVLDDLSTGHDWADLKGSRLVRGSYGDGVLVTGLLRADAIDAVLHTAARSIVPESLAEPARYYRENVGGGLTLLEAMRETGVRRLVISSTAAVYGQPESVPIPEAAPLRPINPYGETKRTFEAAARWYGAAYGLRSVGLRYFNVAGATERNGELHRPETHLIPNALAAVAGDGPPLTLFGQDYPTPDGTPIRDYLHVEDLADAHLSALEATAPDDPRTDGPLVCNLGSGRGFSVREVLEVVERTVGRPVPMTVGPRRAGDPPELVAAIDRAGSILGWTPRRSTLEAMIESAWAWRSARIANEASGRPPAAAGQPG